MVVALSIRQPWAWAIIAGRKHIENRTWRTAVRGRIAIHSSRRRDRVWRKLLNMLVGAEREACEQSPCGCIIGTVELVACVDESDDPAFGGDIGFVLADPQPLAEPIPCRGRLGFWAVPPEIERQIGPASTP